MNIQRCFLICILCVCSQFLGFMTISSQAGQDLDNTISGAGGIEGSIVTIETVTNDNNNNGDRQHSNVVEKGVSTGTITTATDEQHHPPIGGGDDIVVQLEHRESESLTPEPVGIIDNTVPPLDQSEPMTRQDVTGGNLDLDLPLEHTPAPATTTTSSPLVEPDTEAISGEQAADLATDNKATLISDDELIDVIITAPSIDDVIGSGVDVSNRMDTETSEEDDNDILSFDEWKKQKLQEQCDDRVRLQQQQQQGQQTVPPPNTVRASQHHHQGKHGNMNNYASVDCGAKILEHNPETQSASAVLAENRDFYMLNPCNVKIWFTVELCEPIQIQRIDIANFELFSSVPEQFRVNFSDRYPAREWRNLGTFNSKEERSVQTFNTDGQMFTKYLKFEMLSHFGSEHYCPLSLIRVFGTSMVEDYEYSETGHHDYDTGGDSHDYEMKPCEEGGANDDNSRSLLGGAAMLVFGAIKSAAQALTGTTTVITKSQEQCADRRSDIQRDNISVGGSVSSDGGGVDDDDDDDAPISDPTSDVNTGPCYPSIPTVTIQTTTSTMTECEQSPIDIHTPIPHQPQVPTVSIDSIPSLITPVSVEGGGDISSHQPPNNDDSTHHSLDEGTQQPVIVTKIDNYISTSQDIVTLINNDELADAVSSSPNNGRLLVISQQLCDDQYHSCMTTHICSFLSLVGVVRFWCCYDESVESIDWRFTHPPVVLTPSPPPLQEQPPPSITPHTDDDSDITIATLGELNAPPQKPYLPHTGSNTPPIPQSQQSTDDQQQQIDTENTTDTGSILRTVEGQESETNHSNDHDSTDEHKVVLNNDSTIVMETQTDTVPSSGGQDPVPTGSAVGEGVDSGWGGNNNNLPVQGQKESVLMRLKNRITDLELNMSLSSQYLEELSKKYRKQMDEMQRNFDRTVSALTSSAALADDRDNRQQHKIRDLEERLLYLSDIIANITLGLGELEQTVTERQVVWILTVLICFITLCVWANWDDMVTLLSRHPSLLGVTGSVRSVKHHRDRRRRNSTVATIGYSKPESSPLKRQSSETHLDKYISDLIVKDTSVGQPLQLKIDVVGKKKKRNKANKVLTSSQGMTGIRNISNTISSFTELRQAGEGVGDNSSNNITTNSSSSMSSAGLLFRASYKQANNNNNNLPVATVCRSNQKHKSAHTKTDNNSKPLSTTTTTSTSTSEQRPIDFTTTTTTKKSPKYINGKRRRSYSPGHFSGRKSSLCNVGRKIGRLK